MAGTSSRAWPKNSRHTVRIAAGIRCKMKRAEVIMPSQPSFCTPGSPPRNLSVTSLPRPALRKLRALDFEAFGRAVAACCRRGGTVLRQLEARELGVVDLAQIVVEARDFEPDCLGIDHAPPGEIVDRGAPQHRFLAARVHGDVAADAGGVGRGRIDSEHTARRLRRLHHALGHHARAAAYGRRLAALRPAAGFPRPRPAPRAFRY